MPLPTWTRHPCTYKAKAGILQNERVWANAAKMTPGAWYEMYVREALAPRVGQSGHAHSVSSHFSFVV